jgi:Domain of unknown function (DUF4326)
MDGEVRVNVKRDKYDFYLGRNPALYAIPLSKSLEVFANPYSIGKDGGRKQVVEMYEVYIRERLRQEPQLKGELLKLRGKRLACWCGPDQQCHVDIVIKLINECFP